MYLLPLIPMQSSKLELLYSLPSLATHQLAVGPTANMILILGGNASLTSISLRLLGKLWVDYDSVYPHVLTLLEQGMHKNISPEFQVAKAVVIRDICSIRYVCTAKCFMNRSSHQI